MVQVFQDPLCKRHYASIFSIAFIFRLLVFSAAVVLAFLIAYASGGFWERVAMHTEQPTVHYSGDALAIFEGQKAGDELVWSSSPATRAALGSHAVSASVQVGEEDYNFDGKPDMIRFTARIASAMPVHSVKLLLQFNYTLKSMAHVKMSSLAFITAASPLPGAGLSTQGQLELSQTGPITTEGFNAYYNHPLINGARGNGAAAEADAGLQLSSILTAYTMRNLTTIYQNQYPVWQAGNGNGFTLDVRIRIPPAQVVLYKPPAAQALKWGWVQFGAVFLVLWWLLTWFECRVFRFRVLDTRVLSDVPAVRGGGGGSGGQRF